MPRDSLAAMFDEPPAGASQRKSVALACLNEAVNHSGIPRKELAADLAITEQTFSKWLSGAERAPLDLPDRLPAAIGDDYYARVQTARQFDPVAVALEAAGKACYRALVALGMNAGLPQRAGKPIKASVK